MIEPLQSSDPRQLGPWSIKARLGQGGMGIVFLGEKNGVKSALKVVRSSFLDDPSLKNRFLREVEILKKIDSNNVAKIIEAEVSQEFAWFASEYVEGFNLKEHVLAHGPLKEHDWLDFAKQILTGFSEIHQLNIVHRDVKPSNIIMGLGIPKIIDFGVAFSKESTSLTTTGFVVGSPAWLSPEQITGKNIGLKSDIFSVGSILAFAASGNSPWSDSERTETATYFFRILSEEPNLEYLTDFQKDFVLKLLNKDPEKRPSAIEAQDLVSNELKRIQEIAELKQRQEKEKLEQIKQELQREEQKRAEELLKADREKVKKESREQKKKLKYANISNAPQQISTELTQTEIIYREPIKQKSNSRKKSIVIALSIAASLVVGIGLFQIIDVSSNSESYEQASIQNSNESIAESVQSADTPENNNNIDSESIAPAANPSPSDSNISEPSQAEVEESEIKTEVNPSPDTSESKSISKNKGQVCRTIDRPGMPTACWSIGSKAKISACIVQGENYTVTAKFFKEGQQIDSYSTTLIGGAQSNGEICTVFEGRASGNYDANVPNVDLEFLTARQIDMIGWVVQGQGFNQTMTDFYTWK